MHPQSRRRLTGLFIIYAIILVGTILFLWTYPAHPQDGAYQPDGGTFQVVTYEGFVLAYDEGNEQAAWVVYELTAEEVAGTEERKGRFRFDPRIWTGSAHPDDYRNTGFDRGHLVPAADLRWSEVVMKQGYLMSNASPQLPKFNRGIWRVLEGRVRQAAVNRDTIHVVTGPVHIGGSSVIRIGKNRVRVPVAFFKVVFDPETLERLAYVIPQKPPGNVFDDLSAYRVTINTVERLTGLNLFPGHPCEDEIERSNLWQR